MLFLINLWKKKKRNKVKTQISEDGEIGQRDNIEMGGVINAQRMEDSEKNKEPKKENRKSSSGLSNLNHNKAPILHSGGKRLSVIKYSKINGDGRRDKEQKDAPNESKVISPLQVREEEGVPPNTESPKKNKKFIRPKKL